MGEAVAQEGLVAFAELMVNASGSKVFAGVICEQAPIVFKLVHNERIACAGGGINSQNIGQDGGASSSRQRWLASETWHRSSAEGGQTLKNRHLIIGAELAAVRPEDIGVGQERPGILRVLPQAFRSNEAEGLVFAQGEAHRSAKLL